MDRTRERMLLTLPAVALLIAACSSGGGAATTAPTAAPPTTASTPAPASEPPMSAPAAAITLTVAQDATLGAYVTGENGMSLYIFTPDAAAPGKSVCTGDCETNWPPLTVDAASDVAAGDGVSGALGTITRDDGSLQVTLGGNPLYYFAHDQAAGDVNGQGVNDVWFLASGDGTGVGAPKASPTDRPLDY